MALSTLHKTRHDTGSGRPAAPLGHRNATAGRADHGRDPDGMAVASFVLGLLGLLVANIFLGPVAIMLAALALGRGTERRGRAFLGLALGVADLAVLAVLVSADHTLSWSIAG